MQYQTNILNSLSQCSTPLNTLFFSDFNVERIQRGIQNKIKQQTGRSIDRQNRSDLIAIMRTVFITNSVNPYGEACKQVDFMNDRVIKTAAQQVNTGLAQYIGYIKDISTTPVPLDLPRNTDQYGTITNVNTRIGM